MGLIGFSVIFLVFYIAFCIGVGIYGQLKAKGSEQYVVAKRTMNPIIIAVAAAATVGSGITFLGCPGFAFKFGYAGLWYSASWTWSIPLVTLITFFSFRKLVHEKGSMTIPGFLGDRYNSDTARVLAVLLACVAQLFFLGGQYTGAGHIMSAIFDIPYSYGVILMGVVVAFYVAAGGYRSIAVTNTAMGFLMAICALLLFFSAYVMFPGGVSALNAKLVSIDPNTVQVFNPKAGPIGGSIMAVFCIGLPLAFYAFSPQTSAHLLSTKDFSFKTIITYTFVIWGLFIIFGLTPFAGLAAQAHGIVSPRADAALALMVKQMFHPLFAAFLLVAILSAIWSTADVVLFAIATGISNELFANVIFKRMGWSPNKIDKWNMRIARILVIVLSILSVLMVLNPPKYLVVFIWIGLGGAMVIVAPVVVVSSMWKRATKVAAIGSMIIGAIIFYTMIIKGVQPFTASGIQLPITFASMILISLFTKPETEQLEKAEG
jgi:sodium/proline symporter